MQPPIYLDNNATTPLAPVVIAAMTAAFEVFGNPSSAHSAGKSAREIVENARASVAKLIGAKNPEEIAFTSGGTDSDNWAILGALESQPGKDHIVTTRVEHEAVRKLCEKLESRGSRVSWIDVDEKGRLDLGQLCDALSSKTAVVSVMMANNETGVIFPVNEIANIVKANSAAIFHVDAVNAAGKMPINIEHSGIDLLSLSAHKFHAPKGIGALYIRDGVRLSPIQIGGGQERGRRAGTEAVHQIAGLGTAAELAADLSPMKEICRLRDKLESSVLQQFDLASVNGDLGNRLPNTSNISFENLNGEMILHYLDEAGICVSTGSACNSESKISSPVLAAMNIPYSKVMGSIRFSLGRTTIEAEIDQTITALESIVDRLA
ncbi:MAG TPA: aminotransferase class V-fold PLP-dependent enzyme [Pyrinomonadaceae bacterium]|nr:aminotransferase class V-fold PLP-dependent enzyme [Pyrinomonadaceae bacterium]